MISNVQSRASNILPRLKGKPVKWTRTQYEFIMTKAEEAWLAGAFGVGKTSSLLWRGFRLARQIPGGMGMIGTDTGPNIHRVIEPLIRDLWRDVIVGSRKRPIPQFQTMTEGEEPFTWTLQPFKEHEKLGGDTLSVVLGDEMNRCSVLSHRALAPRLRESAKNYLCYASNNKGKDWLYKMFVKGNLDNTQPNMWWKTTSTHENLHNLPDNYLEKFRGFPEKWWDRNIHGKFIEFEGSVYDMLSEKVHLIPLPKEIKPYWTINYTLDHGFDHPTVCILWYTDEHGNSVAFDEYYQRGMDPVDNARAIVEFLKPYKDHGEFGVYGYADPSMWAQHSGSAPMADYEEIFLDAGITPPFPAYVKKGPHHNIKMQGVYKVIAHFKEKNGHKHPITGESPAPALYICENCVQTWDSLIDLSFENNEDGGDEKVAKREGDDGSDCTWYHVWNDPAVPTSPDNFKRRVELRESLRKNRDKDMRGRERFCAGKDFDDCGVAPEVAAGVGPRDRFVNYTPERGY